jgi:hypothetical protein
MEKVILYYIKIQSIVLLCWSKKKGVKIAKYSYFSRFNYTIGDALRVLG